MSFGYDWEPTDGQCYSFAVSYTAEPYRPARINGDPDDCYPAEGGISDVEVELQRAEIVLFNDESQTLVWDRRLRNHSFPEDFAAKVEDAVQRTHEDELHAACEDAEEDAYETALADRDDALEARRDDR